MSSENVQPDVEPRTIRAATEHMTVIETAHALFSVTTESGSEYTVDLREPACSCPDYRHREEVKECKHIRRVRLVTGQVDIARLESKLLERAADLESDVEELTEQAERLSETAGELRDATDRLAAVTNE